MRFIGDIKFKRKKRLEAKNKPKPKYTPPNRTPEQRAEIDREMKRLYKEYHVTVFEKIKRVIEEIQINRRADK